MPKQPIETKRPLASRTIRSGVFTAHRGEPRSILPALSPIVWAVDCAAEDPGSTVEIRPVSIALATARITRNRGTIGAIIEAPTRGDAETQILALRASSRRIPVFMFCPDDRLFGGVAASFGVTSERQVFGSAGARDALRAFVGECERHARSQHERIDEFAAWRGLTSAEADLLYRLATGVRPLHMHDAQGVGIETKKDRIAKTREKCWKMSLEEILDIALNRISQASR